MQPSCTALTVHPGLGRLQAKARDKNQPHKAHANSVGDSQPLAQKQNSGSPAITIGRRRSMNHQILRHSKTTDSGQRICKCSPLRRKLCVVFDVLKRTAPASPEDGADRLATLGARRLQRNHAATQPAAMIFLKAHARTISRSGKGHKNHPTIREPRDPLSLRRQRIDFYIYQRHRVRCQNTRSARNS